MRILVWNINMAAHKKLSLLRQLAPDIAILPECAAPDVIVSKCPGFTFTDAQWLERSRHKGLGVFGFGDFYFTRSSFFDPRFEVFLPVEVTGRTRFNLLAVWALNFRAGSGSTMLDALQFYRRFLESTDSVVAGDFNNSVFWDRPNKQTNFSGVAAILSELGLSSAYHAATGEAFARERHPTLWFLKRLNQGYHIDYCFLPRPWLANPISVWVGQARRWLARSDHAPLVVSVNGSDPHGDGAQGHAVSSSWSCAGLGGAFATTSSNPGECSRLLAILLSNVIQLGSRVGSVPQLANVPKSLP